MLAENTAGNEIGRKINNIHICDRFYTITFALTYIVVSLENVITDIADMEKGMEMTKREYEARKDRDPPVILKDFLANSEDKIKKLRADAKSAQVSGALCVCR